MGAKPLSTRWTVRRWRTGWQQGMWFATGIEGNFWRCDTFVTWREAFDRANRVTRRSPVGSVVGEGQ